VRKPGEVDLVRQVLLGVAARQTDLAMLERTVNGCGKQLVVLSIDVRNSRR
jgi:hypothetical protein